MDKKPCKTLSADEPAGSLHRDGSVAAYELVERGRKFYIMDYSRPLIRQVVSRHLTMVGAQKKLEQLEGVAGEGTGKMPRAKCEGCGSENLKDTGSFMVETHKCQDCGEIFCQDSAGCGLD
jgi:hypothetical protein